MFKENIPLAEFSSYRIGGPARYFFEANSISELKDALAEARKKKIKIFILAGGTNLLISDEGFDGLVVRPNFSAIEISGSRVRVEAGASMENLLQFAVSQRLSGLEWAGGLPGTVGGAIRGNAGAFGSEIKDVVTGIKSLNTKTLEEINRQKSECNFFYRTSIFKEANGKEIILAAEFELKKGDKEALQKSVLEKIIYRRERHPLEHPNIGSIFKNVALNEVPPEHLTGMKEVVKTDPFLVVPAAHLISEAGLKGISFGGAMISPKHPNFIVNVLQARASDVKTLIELVKDRVEEKFGINLEEEIGHLA